MKRKWMIWMLSGLIPFSPSHVNSLGSYILFEGTPYVHLMIYQHPKGVR